MRACLFAGNFLTFVRSRKLGLQDKRAEPFGKRGSLGDALLSRRRCTPGKSTAAKRPRPINAKRAPVSQSSSTPFGVRDTAVYHYGYFQHRHHLGHNRNIHTGRVPLIRSSAVDAERIAAGGLGHNRKFDGVLAIPAPARADFYRDGHETAFFTLRIIFPARAGFFISAAPSPGETIFLRGSPYLCQESAPRTIQAQSAPHRP